MYKLSFFVPPSHLESVKEALFNAGAGKIGDYEHCCWQTLGTGQFRGLPSSEPYLGKKGHLEQVEEYKVELVCEDDLIRTVIAALKASHPYEEPAFDVFRLESL